MTPQKARIDSASLALVEMIQDHISPDYYTDRFLDMHMEVLFLCCTISEASVPM